MKESYLDYYYASMSSDSEWLFVTPSLESRDLQLEVQELGHFIFDGKQYTRRGSLNSFQIVCYQCRTPGKITFRGREFPFPNENEILFLDCRQNYSIETEGHADAYFVHFWSPLVCYYYELFMEMNGGSPVLHAYSQVVRTNLHRLFEIYRNPNTRNSDIYAEELIMEMVMDMLKLVTPTKKNSHSGYVHEVLKLISEAYSEDITLDLLAKRVHVSKYYLSHIFKKEIGITPASYIQQYRIGKAKELLRTTDLSQEIICDKVGLYNCSYLSKLFRMYEGLTPDQYRKKWN